MQISHDESTTYFDENKNVVALKLWIKLINTGNTGTKNLRVKAECKTLAPPEQPNPWDNFEGDLEITGGHHFFIAAHTDERVGCDTPFSANQIKEIQGGTLIGYVFVNTVYGDVFSKKEDRVTQRVIKINKIRQSSNNSSIHYDIDLLYVGDHDCADEECPKQPHDKKMSE